MHKIRVFVQVPILAPVVLALGGYGLLTLKTWPEVKDSFSSHV